jgi:hypothetical protein
MIVGDPVMIIVGTEVDQAHRLLGNDALGQGWASVSVSLAVGASLVRLVADNVLMVGHPEIDHAADRDRANDADAD